MNIETLQIIGFCFMMAIIASPVIFIAYTISKAKERDRLSKAYLRRRAYNALRANRK